MTIKVVILKICQFHQQKYALSRMLKKIVYIIADFFINASILQANIQNIVVFWYNINNNNNAYTTLIRY